MAKRAFLSLLALTLLSASCTSSGTPAAPKQPSQAARLGLIIPATYQQACAVADGVCMPGDGGPIPGKLRRPLHLPVLAPGESCPASHGYAVKTPFASGIILGRGPVRPLIAGRVTEHGTATLGKAAGFAGWRTLQLIWSGAPRGPRGASPRWRALKVVWFSLPAYRGPFVVRGRRLDRPGLLAFGASPTVGPLVVPPGPTMEGYGGYRTVSDAAWVKRPGCYGWQVDGANFSDTIVVNAVLQSAKG